MSIVTEETIKLRSERRQLLIQVEKLMEKPAILLGFAWLLLLMIELTQGLNPALEIVSLIIWGLFILEFIIKLVIAPEKKVFLKRNIITIISLIIPAVRIARLFLFARFIRTLRLARLIGSLNRSLKSLNTITRHRAIGSVFIFTLIVLFAGAAGIYHFEKENDVISSYYEAIWWTSMLLITIGSEYWPLTSEGRVLSFFIAFYGFTVLGYITATIASFFIEKDTGRSGKKQLAELTRKVADLQKILDKPDEEK